MATRVVKVASLLGDASGGAVRVGISGWSYKPWRNVFYPPGLRLRDQLNFASRAFSSIELNGSFYSLQRPESYRSWRDATPDGFVFSIKGGRYVTHLKRLRECEQGLANFFASGVLELEAKLGPVLWQLPPTLKFDPERLSEFFEMLPRTHEQAAELARQHADWLTGRVAFGAGGRAKLRHTLEVRHESFACPEFVALLKKHQIALCVADSAGLYPLLEDQSADFSYVRLHGSTQLYTSGYTHTELAEWAQRIRAFRSGGHAPSPRLAMGDAPADGRKRDVFVYFDNDVKVRAPFDAWNLERLLRGDAPRDPPESLASVTEEPRSVWAAWR